MKEITLERLPATVEELAAMPRAALTVPEEVAALTVAALARFPENQEDAVRMPYSRSQLAEGYLTLYVNCSGADSPRPLKLRKKPSTGQWFLWEQQLLAGIRIPAAADPWL